MLIGLPSCWSCTRPRLGGIRESFMKVLPRDYATMMKAMVDAEEHGLDENETTFMEVSHG